ncbi:MAG TPA: hypothetical protein VM305_08275 [Candidatus Limnocylindrales bacterium]|nr:hypothetical protein [Candidatus Limnocylindrales bacterium]
MTATGYRRGHPIAWDGEQWRMEDGSPAEDRACPKCGQMPTPEGYDACLGHLEGVTSACCGHGVEDKYEVVADR